MIAKTGYFALVNISVFIVINYMSKITRDTRKDKKVMRSHSAPDRTDRPLPPTLTSPKHSPHTTKGKSTDH
jgi:hypothetical protein